MKTLPKPKTMNTEIERKFLIKMPDAGQLARLDGCVVTLIRQTYLFNDNGSERVRARMYGSKTVYTHTTKQRITFLSAYEDEQVIDQSGYLSLLKRRDPERNDIYKTRLAVPFDGHVFEVDIYPFWRRQAVMEVELSGEGESVVFPPFIEIIREVSDDRSYSNKSLSKKIPDED